MSTPHIIMWAVAVCVGLPAAYRNPTAAAVSLSWLAGEITWMVTGNNLPLKTYVTLDIVVVTVIIAKGIIRAGRRSWPRLTVCDGFVLALFFFGAWPVYVSGLHPYYEWWALYYIKLAQFTFVGLEALTYWYAARRAKRWRDPNILQFAPAYSRRAKRYFSPPPASRLRGGGSGV